MRNAARRGHPARAIVAGWRKLLHSVPVEAADPPSALTEGARAPVPAASEFVPTTGQPASLSAGVLGRFIMDWERNGDCEVS